MKHYFLSHAFTGRKSNGKDNPWAYALSLRDQILHYNSLKNDDLGRILIASCLI